MLILPTLPVGTEINIPLFHLKSIRSVGIAIFIKSKWGKQQKRQTNK